MRIDWQLSTLRQASGCVLLYDAAHSHITLTGADEITFLSFSIASPILFYIVCFHIHRSSCVWATAHQDASLPGAMLCYDAQALRHVSWASRFRMPAQRAHGVSVTRVRISS